MEFRNIIIWNLVKQNIPMVGKLIVFILVIQELNTKFFLAKIEEDAKKELIGHKNSKVKNTLKI